jgi:hypothetical protein
VILCGRLGWLLNADKLSVGTEIQFCNQPRLNDWEIKLPSGQCILPMKL